MISFFKRKPAAPTPGPINEDWSAGDLAECLNGDGWTHGYPGPKRGHVLRVVDVHVGRNVDDGTPGWGLTFITFPASFSADQFRKVKPASDEFAARIRACRPADNRVPA